MRIQTHKFVIASSASLVTRPNGPGVLEEGGAAGGGPDDGAGCRLVPQKRLCLGGDMSRSLGSKENFQVR